MKDRMTQLLISVPNSEVKFISTLARKMGWKIEQQEDLLEKFINSDFSDVQISDEEIQQEVDAVRYKNENIN